MRKSAAGSPVEPGRHGRQPAQAAISLPAPRAWPAPFVAGERRRGLKAAAGQVPSPLSPDGGRGIGPRIVTGNTYFRSQTAPPAARSRCPTRGAHTPDHLRPRGTLVEAMSGLAARTGFPDREPVIAASDCDRERFFPIPIRSCFNFAMPAGSRWPLPARMGMMPQPWASRLTSQGIPNRNPVADPARNRDRWSGTTPILLSAS